MDNFDSWSCLQPLLRNASFFYLSLCQYHLVTYQYHHLPHSLDSFNMCQGELPYRYISVLFVLNHQHGSFVEPIHHV